VSETYSGSGLLSGLSITRDLDTLNRVQTLTASEYATVTFGYDAASRLATLQQGNSSVSYEYNNALGRVREVTIETNGNQRYQRVLTHDNIGRIQRVETFGNPQQQHTLRDYQYNTANQRTHVSDELGQQWHYQYDALGQLGTKGVKRRI
jgi:YD repeat-containing protein